MYDILNTKNIYRNSSKKIFLNKKGAKLATLFGCRYDIKMDRLGIEWKNKIKNHVLW